jgi:hypothetical protein
MLRNWVIRLLGAVEERGTEVVTMATIAARQSSEDIEGRGSASGGAVLLRKGVVLRTLLLLLLAGGVGAGLMVAQGNAGRMQGVAEQIIFKAEQLRDATQGPGFRGADVEGILTELRGLIDEYEEMIVFAESPYPGEILLGTTPSGDSTWLETLCDTRYGGFLKEIRIRRTGGRANYLRINDIEITHSTPTGQRREVFNEGGRVKLYRNGVFKLALPAPMRVRRIRININHESTGLEVTGVPYVIRSTIREPLEKAQYPGEVLLGTTPPGDSTWLETLCSTPFNRPVREIRLRRTGGKASYLRINDIEISCLTPRGIEKHLFNQGGRSRLYADGVYSLVLPRPMRITHIRILVDHESAGLQVYGVH